MLPHALVACVKRGPASRLLAALMFDEKAGAQGTHLLVSWTSSLSSLSLSLRMF